MCVFSCYTCQGHYLVIVCVFVCVCIFIILYGYTYDFWFPKSVCVHLLLWILNEVYLLFPLLPVCLPGFSCNCNPQYTGGHCEMEITACVPNPCQNGGVCKAIGNAFLCSCRRGFKGLTWVPGFHFQTYRPELKVIKGVNSPHSGKIHFVTHL